MSPLPALRSAIFEGSVFHRRLRPKRHELRYRVFSLLLDLDELPELDRRMSWFGHNRRRVCSFLDRDHGDGMPGGLKAWVLRQLDSVGVDGTALRIEVLCYPRLLGYVFNPLSVYFCRRADDSVAAMLYEVNNTFGERHTYVMPVAGADAVIHQSCDKAMEVSPFNRVEGRYDFSVRPPEAGVSVGILYRDASGPLLVATFAGQRRPLDDRSILRMLCAYPLMTLKVIAGIHWEALRLLLKGVRFQRRPAAEQPLNTTIPQPKTTPESHVA